MKKSSHIRQPVNQLISRAKANPDGLLFDNGVNEVTNKECLEFVRKLANYFREVGIKPGDIIGLNMPPTLYIYFLLAIWYQNGVATNYTKQISQEISWGPDWVFSTVKLENCKGAKLVIINQDILEQIKLLDPVDNLKSYKSITDSIVLIFSSGTTGAPKSFPLSIENLEARMSAYWDPSLKFRGSLYLLDIGSASGIGSFYGELRSNGCYFVPGDSQTNVRIVLKHKIQSVLGSPNQLIDFFSAAKEMSVLNSQVSALIVTGSTLPEGIAAEMRDYFKCEILNAYGSQEAGLISQRSGSGLNPFDLGKVIPGMKIEIVNESNNRLPIGVTGKIRAKSKAVTSGYFRDRETSLQYFKDKWFYSGDLGHFENNTHLYLDGRESEVINVGGVKINPAKLDTFLVGKFGVIDAGSFRFSETLGQENLGIALVTSAEFQQNLMLEAIMDFFGSSFPLHLYKVNKISRNRNGKVSRLKIASDYLNSLKI